MLDNHRTLSLLIGVGLIFVVPISIGTFAFSTLLDDDEGQKAETTDSSAEEDSFDGLAREQNIKITPLPPVESNGSGGVGYDSSGGIPIGRYSHPPTRIESFEEDYSNTNRSLDSPGSSIELNRLRQEQLDSSIPDYSMPSSSNNFKSTEDNNLIDSLSDDMLEVPESETETETEIPPLSPITEPLSGQ